MTNSDFKTIRKIESLLCIPHMCTLVYVRLCVICLHVKKPKKAGTQNTIHHWILLFFSFFNFSDAPLVFTLSRYSLKTKHKYWAMFDYLFTNPLPPQPPGKENHSCESQMTVNKHGITEEVIPTTFKEPEVGNISWSSWIEYVRTSHKQFWLTVRNLHLHSELC